MRRLASIPAAGALLVALAIPALADDPYHPVVEEIDVSAFPVVRVVVSVTDGAGRPARGLQAGDLVIREGGSPVSATVDLSSVAKPAAIVIAIDTSGSTGTAGIADARAAAAALVRALEPGDQAAVMTFDERTLVVQPWTADRQALLDAIDAVRLDGNTALYDAVGAAIDLLATAPLNARPSMAVLSDGRDTASRSAPSAALARVRDAGVPLFAFGLGAEARGDVLQALAGASSGGRVLATADDLAAVPGLLREQILTRYTATYRSALTALADGAAVSLAIQLVRAGGVVASVPALFTVPAGRGAPTLSPPPPSASRPADASLPPPTAPRSTAVAPASEDRLRWEAILVGLLGGSAVLSFVLALQVVLRRSSETRRRIGELVAARPGHVAGLGRGAIAGTILPLFARTVRPLERVTPSAVVSGTRRRLARAGEPLGFGPTDFLAIRGFTSAAIGVVGVALAGGRTGDWRWIVLGGAFGLALGHLIPGALVDAVARARQREILRALPSALDMLALCASAGLTVDGSIAQVSRSWRNPLTVEFRRLLAEVRAGRDRRDALRALAERAGVPEVTQFAGVLGQVESLGIPLAKVFQEQAADMRVRRRQHAEELVRTAPVKMLFPMVFLIFPALFVVILGPAVPRILEIFAGSP